jgi:hypothetical protein
MLTTSVSVRIGVAVQLPDRIVLVVLVMIMLTTTTSAFRHSLLRSTALTARMPLGTIPARVCSFGHSSASGATNRLEVNSMRLWSGDSSHLFHTSRHFFGTSAKQSVQKENNQDPVIVKSSGSLPSSGNVDSASSEFSRLGVMSSIVEGLSNQSMTVLRDWNDILVYQMG